ncbi:hypothetical protein AURDEDRAFT_171071 [Auricularia subglabra TFB-10046 SS5]|nr:hypothetical protein AURDEDRAFT_171071 [Auricularia subglabra TFB-10046 SS5]
MNAFLRADDTVRELSKTVSLAHKARYAEEALGMQISNAALQKTISGMKHELDIMRNRLEAPTLPAATRSTAPAGEEVKGPEQGESLEKWTGLDTTHLATERPVLVSCCDVADEGVAVHKTVSRLNAILSGILQYPRTSINVKVTHQMQHSILLQLVPLNYFRKRAM